ncbi:hypothetical protein CEXT_239881 [Caerostris extrusa]|uniref:Secreted protein n=1 Tax=Caerostris extrusa TaxID=172846 RepID=A0AAV4S6P5_CAEEX|nr:hypothetical protein CEXT_239881 [Caerostris extrusa]
MGIGRGINRGFSDLAMTAAAINFFIFLLQCAGSSMQSERRWRRPSSQTSSSTWRESFCNKNEFVKRYLLESILLFSLQPFRVIRLTEHVGDLC